MRRYLRLFSSFYHWKRDCDPLDMQQRDLVASVHKHRPPHSFRVTIRTADMHLDGSVQRLRRRLCHRGSGGTVAGTGGRAWQTKKGSTVKSNFPGAWASHHKHTPSVPIRQEAKATKLVITPPGMKSWIQKPTVIDHC
jgi:hypothetical protein